MMSFKNSVYVCRISPLWLVLLMFSLSWLHSQNVDSLLRSDLVLSGRAECRETGW
jgi:hypothetical protein